MTVRTCLIPGFVFCSTTQVAQAGMPPSLLHLTHIAELRLQSISFFLMVLLASAFFLKRLWNFLARDFPKLPLLSYQGALAGSVLCGLTVLFVMTTISGAQELLAPDARERPGQTKQLVQADSEKVIPLQSSLKVRRAKLDELHFALFVYAAAHEGKLPDNPEATNFAEEFWVQPGGLNVKYGYVKGQKVGDSYDPIAFEQAVYDDGKQLILFADGSIKVLTLEEAKDWLDDK